MLQNNVSHSLEVSSLCVRKCPWRPNLYPYSNFTVKPNSQLIFSPLFILLTHFLFSLFLFIFVFLLLFFLFSRPSLLATQNHLLRLPLDHHHHRGGRKYYSPTDPIKWTFSPSHTLLTAMDACPCHLHFIIVTTTTNNHLALPPPPPPWPPIPPTNSTCLFSIHKHTTTHPPIAFPWVTLDVNCVIIIITNHQQPTVDLMVTVIVTLLPAHYFRFCRVKLSLSLSLSTLDTLSFPPLYQLTISSWSILLCGHPWLCRTNTQTPNTFLTV